MTAAQDIALRVVVPDDEPFLNRVYASTRAGELSLLPWTEEQKRAFTDMQHAAQSDHYLNYYPKAQYLIIELNGLPVGRLYVDRWEREIRIIDIALLPDHRRLGVGSLLIRQLQDEAASAGKILSIHVELNNPALDLYTRLGFRPVAEVGVYLLLHWIAPGS